MRLMAQNRFEILDWSRALRGYLFHSRPSDLHQTDSQHAAKELGLTRRRALRPSDSWLLLKRGQNLQQQQGRPLAPHSVRSVSLKPMRTNCCVDSAIPRECP